MSLFKNQTRLAMAYTNKVGDKVYPVVVDIKKGIKSTEDIQFVSSDVNTGILSVAFIQGNDNYNVTGADVVCSVMRPDASTLELPCEVVGENIVEVPLGINGTSQDGVYSFDFKVLKGENKVVGTPIMNYSVSLSIDNDMVVEEDDRLPVLTVLMTQLTELKNETNEVISTANTAIQNANKATDDTKLAISNAQSATQEAEDVIARVNNAIASGTQDLEVREARDGETSLKARLDRDIEKAKQVYVELEGSYISTESSTGAIQDLEILGNTVQDPNNLADIKSVGVLQEDGTYKMSILSCGKNLFDGKFIDGKAINFTTGEYYDNNNMCASANFISANGNSSYYLNISPYAWAIEYDANKKCIAGRQFWNTFTTSENCRYVKFYIQTSAKIDTIQLEEGTVSTPYEPYQENKCDILLPCQLEKVGDVSDRLYYDDVEKAWCIEKNIGNVGLNGSERTGVFNTNATLTNYIQIIHPGMKLVNNTPIILSTFKNENYSSSKDYEYGYSWVINGESCIYLNFLKSKGNTDSEFKNWLSQNPTLVKYQLATPQKIILPLDVQIQLNSFFGTTHVYMESGEVEGTIKCKISKSLGATVQSLNNKTDILSDRIEAIEGLKDSQNMKYETDKGYLVCKETKNGVIDDLKIEGKTLVNKYLFKHLSLSTNNDEIRVLISNRISNGVYTIVNYANKTIMLEINDNNDGHFIKNISIDSNSIKAITLSENEGFDIIKGIQHHNWDVNSEVDKEAMKKQLILEGDHTQNPPSYFEGLMSVGQDVDKIEVLSRKEDGNLIDVDFTKYGISNSNGVNIGYDSIEGLPTQGGFAIHSKVFLEKGSYVCKVNEVSGVNHRIRIREINNSDIIYANITNIKFDIKESKMYKISFENNGNTTTSFKLKGISLQHYNKGSIYPHKSDKKQILFYNENGELKPIQELHEWDSIEKHSDNKWYYHKRSGKVVLNGSEGGIILLGDNTTSTLGFSINKSNFPNIKKISVYPDENKVFNDRFNYLGGTLWNVDSVGIALNADDDTRMFQIKLLKTSLNTQDVAGFKQWLQANNVTVVYQLAEEEVYELAPLHLDSYANETLILCNSGAISPKMEFSITSHINELVKSQGDRISLLEEKMYKALKQVLAGDMYSLAELLYPEDFVEENPENEIMLLPFE